MAGGRLKYTLAKPKVRGEKILLLKPFELLDRLAKLIPPPRSHRHMYHVVLAPHSPLRAKVVMFAGKEMTLISIQMEKIILGKLSAEESNLPPSALNKKLAQSRFFRGGSSEPSFFVRIIIVSIKIHFWM